MPHMFPMKKSMSRQAAISEAHAESSPGLRSEAGRFGPSPRDTAPALSLIYGILWDIHPQP